MKNAIFRMCHPSHVEEYTLIGRVSFQNFRTIRRAMRSKENILGCLSNRNKGTVSCCISMFGCRGYLLDNDCYASLAFVLIQIQYGSVSRSHQLLRYLETRLYLIEDRSALCSLRIFVLLCQNGLQ